MEIILLSLITAIVIFLVGGFLGQVAFHSLHKFLFKK